ncbi:hypothetical protein EJB05_54566, partial [Eragrostis curvula]
MTSPAPPPSCSKTTGAPGSRYCLCAPTTHPGSFRCRLHRSPPAAKVTAPPSGSEAVKEAAAAAAARGLLARVKRKPRQPDGLEDAYEDSVQIAKSQPPESSLCQFGA